MNVIQCYMMEFNDEKNKSNTENKLIHSLDLEYMDLIDVFVTI